MKTIKQKDIAAALNIDQALVSRMVNGKQAVPWPLARRMSEMFPGKDIVGWKEASPTELKRAFAQLPINGEAA